MTLAADPELSERLIGAVDEQRLIDTACAYVSTPSPTGSEQAMGETVRTAFEDAGLTVSWQQVEDGRPNVIGTVEGQGGGPTGGAQGGQTSGGGSKDDVIDAEVVDENK